MFAPRALRVAQPRQGGFKAYGYPERQCGIHARPVTCYLGPARLPTRGAVDRAASAVAQTAAAAPNRRAAGTPAQRSGPKNKRGTGPSTPRRRGLKTTSSKTPPARSRRGDARRNGSNAGDDVNDADDGGTGLPAHWSRVAVIGRPNVGKSALFNRLVGRRAAIVHDAPGVTRDRLYAGVHWAGRAFALADTGGLMADATALMPGRGKTGVEDDALLAAAARELGAQGLPWAVERQTAAAAGEAAALVLCVDGREGPTPADEELADWIRRAFPGKPVVLAVNKCEPPGMGIADAAQFWSLGLGEPYAVSAMTGTGTGELLDALVQALPAAVEQGGGSGGSSSRDGAETTVWNDNKNDRAGGNNRGIAVAAAVDDDSELSASTATTVLKSQILAQQSSKAAVSTTDAGWRGEDHDDGSVVNNRWRNEGCTEDDDDAIDGWSIQDGEDPDDWDDQDGEDPDDWDCHEGLDVGVSSARVNRDITHHDDDNVYDSTEWALLEAEARDAAVDAPSGDGAQNRDAPALPAPLTAVAIIGRPNVGKSSLLNALAGEERAVVSPVPGTTRDAVDVAVAGPDGARYLLVDTAGLRRPAAVTGSGDIAESLAVARALRALRRAHVALLVLDAGAGVTRQDMRLAELVASQGRACVVVVNKWDAVDPAAGVALADFEARVRAELRPIEWASVVFCSARTRLRLSAILDAVRAAAVQYRRRLPTATLNMVLRDAAAMRSPPTLSGRRRLRVYYGTQAGVAPPSFVLFTNAPGTEVPLDYRRFMERQLREQAGFPGTPLRLLWRGKRDR